MTSTLRLKGSSFQIFHWTMLRCCFAQKELHRTICLFPMLTERQLDLTFDNLPARLQNEPTKKEAQKVSQEQ